MSENSASRNDDIRAVQSIAIENSYADATSNTFN